MSGMAQVNNRTVYVQPTTGGRIEINLPPDSSVSNLKMLVAKRIKVPKDKIVLLFKNKQLTDGSLDENSITEGSKLILLPNVETGLMAQNPEQCVMQALETLNESQVDNFLAGRSPLTLTIRLGDHMMFIQLQLSTISSPSSSNSTSAPSSSLPTPPTTPTSSHPLSTSPFSSASSSSPSSSSSSPPLPSTSLSSSISSTLSPPPSPHSTSPPSSSKSSLESSQSSLSSKVFTEASRNLTQTLKQLSSSALTKKMNESCDGRCCLARRQGGAVIESMYHHGKGVFSGTFSGTLNPILQDRDGRPRRNICTIIHILNDLLGASSHCNPSAQCLCSNMITAHSKIQKTSPVKSKSDDKQVEDKVLKEKVQYIQTKLKERRLNRSARREERASPYPSHSHKNSNESTSHASKKIDSNGVFLSSINSECSEQTLMDFSSETAVA